MQIVRDEAPVLNVDASNLWEHDQKLYGYLIHYPTEVIPIFDNQANDIAEALKGAADLEHVEYSCLVSWPLPLALPPPPPPPPSPSDSVYRLAIYLRTSMVCSMQRLPCSHFEHCGFSHPVGCAKDRLA